MEFNIYIVKIFLYALFLVVGIYCSLSIIRRIRNRIYNYKNSKIHHNENCDFYIAYNNNKNLQYPAVFSTTIFCIHVLFVKYHSELVKDLFAPLIFFVLFEQILLFILLITEKSTFLDDKIISDSAPIYYSRIDQVRWIENEDKKSVKLEVKHRAKKNTLKTDVFSVRKGHTDTIKNLLKYSEVYSYPT